MSGTKVLVTIDGETESLSGWARRAGLTQRSIAYRYKRGIRGRELVEPGRRRPIKSWQRVKFVDRSGAIYGQLTVIKFVGLGDGRQRVWLCRCDCGEEVEVTYRSLSRGSRVDCGSHKPPPYNLLPTGESGFNQLLASYKRSAVARGVQFVLTRDEFRSLTSSSCFYCGEPPGQLYGSRNAQYTYTGIDRVDNQYGYLPENVRPACSVCNLAKRDLTEVEFARWVRRVAGRIKSVASNRVQWRPE